MNKLIFNDLCRFNKNVVFREIIIVDVFTESFFCVILIINNFAFTVPAVLGIM